MDGMGARAEGFKDAADEGFGGRGGFGGSRLGKMGGEEKEKSNRGEWEGGEEDQIASVDVDIIISNELSVSACHIH